MRALRRSSCLVRTPIMLALAVMCVAMCACSRGAKGKPVHVNGQVLYEGQPLARAQVVLVPLKATDKDNAPRPVGFTDDQGRFQLSTYGDKDGAPEGEYAVLVQWFPQVQRPGQEVEVGPNALPARFSDPAQSPLRVTVARGHADLQPLQVTRN